MARRLELAKLFYTLEANSKGLERELGLAERSLSRTAAFVKANPVLALGALGTAFAAAGAKAVGMAAEFEASMAEVSTLVDTTSVDMQKLAEGVLELYRSLPVESLEELTNGLYNVISAGVPASEAVEYLGVAAKAAVGGVTDVNTAVNGLTTATNAFASQGLTAQEAADKFFTAVRLGKTTFAEISGSIGNVAGLANSLGISLDDLLSNMTALTLGGLNTSTAFNSLRQILANVAKPTKELTDSYPELAKQFDLSALKTKGLTQFMTELAGKLKGNDDAAVKMFGSVEALNAVLSLTADGGTRLNSIQEQMANSAGASALAFEKMAGTNKALNQVLKNEFAAAMIELGEKLLPAVNAGLTLAIRLIDAFTGSARKISLDAATNSVNSLGASLAKLTKDNPRYAESFDALVASMRRVAAPSIPRAFENFQAILGGLERDIDRLTSGQLQALYKGLSTAANSGELTATQMRDVGKSLNLIARELSAQGEQIIPGSATQSLTDAGAAATDLTTNLGRVGPAADDAAKKAREAAEKYAAGMRRIQETLIQSTATLVDDTTLAMQKLREELKAAGVTGEDASRALRPLNEQLALIRVNEKFDLPEILKKSANAFTDRDVHRLVQAQQELDTLYRNTTRGSNEQLAVERQREAVQDKLLSRVTATTAQVTAAIRPSQDLKELAAQYGAEIDEHGRIVPLNTEKTARLADKVREVALGAIGVAEGFGLIDSKAASALKSMVGIADSLPKALSDDPSAIISVLGGLTGVIGALFSGNSAEERARKELIRKNNEALSELVRVNGNLLRVSTPGFKLAGARDALAGVGSSSLFATAETLSQGIGPQREVAQNIVTGLLRQALGTQGLALSDLDTVAKDLGIDIRDKDGRFSFPGLRQLLDALQSGQFTRFADEIQDQFERIKNAIELGLIDPADELAEVIKVLSRPELGKNVPAIAEAFKDLDLSTDAGKAEGIKRIQSLFDALSKGTLDISQFGGLSGSEFRDILVRLFGLLGGKPIEAGAPSANETGEDGGGDGASGGAGAAPGTTDPLVDQLIAPVAPTLGDLLGVNTETRDYVARLLEEVTSGRTLEPPVVPAGFLTRSAPGGSTVSFGDLHITVQVAGTSASADDIARTSAEAVQRSLDEYLERARARERLIRGDGGLP